MHMKTEFKNIKKKARISIVATAIILIFATSCQKDDSEDPTYDGKWVYESSSPVVDQAYFQSYIEIYKDRTFVIYDSSRSLTIEGGENKISPAGLTITDPDTNITHTFKLLGKKDNRLTLKTTFFGPQTTLVLRLSGT